MHFPVEKLGGLRINASMRGFDGFIRECGLKDLPFQMRFILGLLNGVG